MYEAHSSIDTTPVRIEPHPVPELSWELHRDERGEYLLAHGRRRSYRIRENPAGQFVVRSYGPLQRLNSRNVHPSIWQAFRGALAYEFADAIEVA